MSCAWAKWPWAATGKPKPVARWPKDMKKFSVDVVSFAREWLVAKAYGNTRDECAAHARLIALAPELARMVEDCAVVMSGRCPGTSTEKAARALLKRLKGEA